MKRLLVVLGIFLILVVSGCSNQPDLLGGGEYLVYSKKVSDHKHLVRINPDGSGKVQLTSGDHDNVYPEIVGNTIYFSSGGRDGVNAVQIFRMDIDGSDVQRVPINLPNAHMFQPALCGEFLFFSAVRPGIHNHLEIYRVGVKGGSPVRLTTTSAGGSNYTWASMPRCSPLKNQVAFAWTQSESTQIWKMNLDGTNKVQLTFPGERSPGASCKNYAGNPTPCYDECNAPHWGSTGLITMFCGIEQEHGEIFRMNPDGSGQVQLTDDPGINSNDGPVFSPDGEYIIFTHGEPATRSTTLQIMDADGGHRSVVIDDIGPEWTSSWG